MRFLLSWFFLLSFALKWSCPGFLATSLPFFVTFTLFKYDLFDFIYFYCPPWFSTFFTALDEDFSIIIERPFGLFFASSATL